MYSVFLFALSMYFFSKRSYIVGSVTLLASLAMLV